MKNTIFLIVGIILISCSQKKQSDTSCLQFMYGTYKVVFDEENPIETVITRKDSIQYEYYQNDTFIYDVKWIDDCTYLLKEQVDSSQIIQNIITNRTSNQYQFITTYYNSEIGFQMKGTAVIID